MLNDLGQSGHHLQTGFHKRVRRRRWLSVTATVLVAALLSLLAGVVALAHQIETSRTVVQERAALNARIRQLQNILVLMGDAETGQRGYLLTDKRGYLQPYEHALTELPRVLKDIHALGGPDTTLTPKLHTIDELIGRKLAELAETLRLHDLGERAGALALVQTDEGQVLMDDLRRHVVESMDMLRARRDIADSQLLDGDSTIARRAVMTSIALIACIGLAAMQLRTMYRSRRRYEQALRTQTSILNLVIDEIPAMVAILDQELRYRLVNKSFERWRRKRRHDIIGKTIRELAGDEEHERSLPSLRRALAGETVSFEKDYPDATVRHVSITCCPLMLEGGDVGGVVAIGHDVTRDREERSRLQHLSERDALTGLLNRPGFEAEIDRSTVDGLADLTLLYIDLDRFKPVNDQFGHAAGDEVLKVIAQRIRRRVRPGDAVARLGGDEFAVALYGLRSDQDAQRIADEIVAVASEPIRVDQHDITIGASVGIARAREDDEDWRQVIERADDMLYRAKEAGRGRAQGADAGNDSSSDPPLR